jgi:RNA polymerase sigma-70 factor (ECF subfamily)
VRTGNRKAFELLYNETIISLSEYAFNKLKDDHLVKDILQDVFVSIYLRREQIGDGVNIYGYLRNAVRYKVVNALRDRFKNQLSVSGVELLTDIPHTPFEDDVETEKFDNLSNNIQTLPQKCRRAFVLNYVDELSYKDIASEMNISVKTVEKHISKALKVLRGGKWEN